MVERQNAEPHDCPELLHRRSIDLKGIEHDHDRSQFDKGMNSLCSMSVKTSGRLYHVDDTHVLVTMIRSNFI